MIVSDFVTWEFTEKASRVPWDILNCDSVDGGLFLTWLSDNVTVFGKSLVVPQIEYVDADCVGPGSLANLHTSMEYDLDNPECPLILSASIKVALGAEYSLLFQIAHEYSHLVLHYYTPFDACPWNKNGVANPPHSELGVNALARTLIYEYIKTRGVYI